MDAREAATAALDDHAACLDQRERLHKQALPVLALKDLTGRAFLGPHDEAEGDFRPRRVRFRSSQSVDRA